MQIYQSHLQNAKVRQRRLFLKMSTLQTKLTLPEQDLKSTSGR